VKDRGDDRGVVELEIGEDRRDFERMAEIEIAQRRASACPCARMA
jgi:hypothetical protein